MTLIVKKNFNVGWERMMFSVQYPVYNRDEGDEFVKYLVSNEEKIIKLEKILRDHLAMKVNDSDTLSKIHDLIKEGKHGK